MRPMFFEWPVVAARPANTSEVGVHARPIGKGISSGTICAPRVPSSRVHRTIISRTIFGRAPRSARRRFVVFFPPRCRPDVRTTKDVVSVPLSVCACVGRQHVFCFCCCYCCCSLRARSGLVTSAIPPHLVNTKHGRRTDIRWSSASQTDGENRRRYRHR